MFALICSCIRNGCFIIRFTGSISEGIMCGPEYCVCSVGSLLKMFRGGLILDNISVVCLDGGGSGMSVPTGFSCG